MVDGQLKGYKVNPYVRVMAGDGPPIYIQGGQFYSEGGHSILKKDLPPWVDNELKKLSHETKVSCGLENPKIHPSVKASAA
jgi:hypothetical protein